MKMLQCFTLQIMRSGRRIKIYFIALLYKSLSGPVEETKYKRLFSKTKVACPNFGHPALTSSF